MWLGENIESASWVTLGESEEVLWVGRPSLFTLSVPIIGGLLLAIFGSLVYPLVVELASTTMLPTWIRYAPILLIIGGILWAGYSLVDWLRLLYVITDEEIYVKYGLLSRDVTQIRIERVQNTNFEQTPMQRILRYGDVKIFTAGTGVEDVTLQRIPRPEKVTRIVSGSLREIG